MLDLLSIAAAAEQEDAAAEAEELLGSSEQQPDGMDALLAGLDATQPEPSPAASLGHGAPASDELPKPPGGVLALKRPPSGAGLGALERSMTRLVPTPRAAVPAGMDLLAAAAANADGSGGRTSSGRGREQSGVDPSSLPGSPRAHSSPAAGRSASTGLRGGMPAAPSGSKAASTASGDELGLADSAALPGEPSPVSPSALARAAGEAEQAAGLCDLDDSALGSLAAVAAAQASSRRPPAARSASRPQLLGGAASVFSSGAQLLSSPPELGAGGAEPLGQLLLSAGLQPASDSPAPLPRRRQPRKQRSSLGMQQASSGPPLPAQQLQAEQAGSEDAGALELLYASMLQPGTSVGPRSTSRPPRQASSGLQIPAAAAAMAAAADWLAQAQAQAQGAQPMDWDEEGSMGSVSVAGSARARKRQRPLQQASDADEPGEGDERGGDQLAAGEPGGEHKRSIRKRTLSVKAAEAEASDTQQAGSKRWRGSSLGARAYMQQQPQQHGRYAGSLLGWPRGSANNLQALSQAAEAADMLAGGGYPPFGVGGGFLGSFSNLFGLAADLAGGELVPPGEDVQQQGERPGSAAGFRTPLAAGLGLRLDVEGGASAAGSLALQGDGERGLAGEEVQGEDRSLRPAAAGAGWPPANMAAAAMQAAACAAAAAAAANPTDPAAAALAATQLMGSWPARMGLGAPSCLAPAASGASPYAYGCEYRPLLPAASSQQQWQQQLQRSPAAPSRPPKQPKPLRLAKPKPAKKPPAAVRDDVANTYTAEEVHSATRRAAEAAAHAGGAAAAAAAAAAAPGGADGCASAAVTAAAKKPAARRGAKKSGRAGGRARCSDPDTSAALAALTALASAKEGVSRFVDASAAARDAATPAAAPGGPAAVAAAAAAAAAAIAAGAGDSEGAGAGSQAGSGSGASRLGGWAGGSRVEAASSDVEGSRAARGPAAASKFIGVTWRERIQRWEVYVWASSSKRSHYIGAFPTSIHAARAYDVAVLWLMGQDARPKTRLNFPLSDYNLQEIQAEASAVAAMRQLTRGGGLELASVQAAAKQAAAAVGGPGKVLKPVDAERALKPWRAGGSGSAATAAAAAGLTVAERRAPAAAAAAAALSAAAGGAAAAGEGPQPAKRSRSSSNSRDAGPAPPAGGAQAEPDPGPHEPSAGERV